MTTAFDPKRPTETELFSADFARLLSTGETLSTGACKVVLADDGTETDIAAMKSGSASINGTKVVQKVTGGTDGVRYTVIFTATTSAGQTLELTRDLPVQRDQT
jgi:hypothetical protein